ncbi:MAG TPA: hypothetical protein VGG85_11505 [Terracidiphilus sp.]|jgi:hypothetical protein
MSAQGEDTEAAFRCKTTRVLYPLLCLIALGSAGCMHKPLDKRAFSLQGPADFPLMAPSNLPSPPPGDFQEFQLRLAGKQPATTPPPAADCTVKGDLFSIAPAKSASPSLWVVISLNMQGWARRSDSIDVQSEWMRFAHELLALHRAGCFPTGVSPQQVLKQISETIPLPASEELLYNYSFGRAGFVDLVPGMQLVIERASFQTKEGVRVPASPTDQFSERLSVVARPGSGSALHLLGIVSRGLGKTYDTQPASPRAVPARFAASPLLRLMLLTLADDDTRRFPVLLGSTETLELWDAADKIAGGPLTACPPSSSSTLQCLFFDKDSAVSVLMSVWLNGRRVYRPISTTVGSLLGMLPENETRRALATLSIDRPLLDGGYARVDFPHDAEGARKVLLLNGDRLTWHR